MLQFASHQTVGFLQWKQNSDWAGIETAGKPMVWLWQAFCFTPLEFLGIRESAQSDREMAICPSEIFLESDLLVRFATGGRKKSKSREQAQPGWLLLQPSNDVRVLVDLQRLLFYAECAYVCARAPCMANTTRRLSCRKPQRRMQSQPLSMPVREILLVWSLDVVRGELFREGGTWADGIEVWQTKWD